MKYIICCLLWGLSLPLAIGQDFNNYVPLSCAGSIPTDFFTASTKKYNSEIKKLEDQNIKNRKRRDLKQFALESNFIIDNLLQSGIVLFNDPVSIYLNEVAAQLTSADPGFKKKIQVYTLRSTSVNAFATDRGTVFVTLGLLAQLENEAQLAFIISHELTHVQEGHNVDLFLEAKNIERNNLSRQEILNSGTFSDALVAKNRYSKELEGEADAQGIQRFLKTNYSAASLDRLFDVLKYAYLPWDDVKFEPSFIESNGYTFPSKYWLEKVNAISSKVEEEDEDKSTHPNIEVRRNIIKETLAKATVKEGQNFLVSETRFQNLRQVARFELPTLHLHNGQLPEALYTAYLLLHKSPDNLYLQKTVAKALYLSAKFKNQYNDGNNGNSEENSANGDDNRNTNKRNNTEVIVFDGNSGSGSSNGSSIEEEGEAHQVHYLFEVLNAKEMAILAQRYAWPLHQKHPEDKEVIAICEDLNIELSHFFEDLTPFTTPIAAAPDQVAEVVKTAPKNDGDNSEKSKVDKIKEKAQSEPVKEVKNEYWKSAFAGFVHDEKYQESFKKGRAEHLKREERSEYYQSAKGKKEWANDRANDKKHGQRLGIPKIAIVNPFYLKIDTRRKNAIQYVSSEMGQFNMNDLMKEAAKAASMKVSILDVADLRADGVDQFNEIRTLNEWYSEQMDFDDLSLTPGINQDRINAIADKYDTDYFLWTGVISLREEKKHVAGKILLSLLFYPALPFVVFNSVKPEYDMLYYAILFDVRTGRRKTIKFEYFDKRDSDMLLKAHFYDTFLQIKTKE